MISHRRSGHRPKPLLESFFSKEEKPEPRELSWTPIPDPIPGPQLIFDAGVKVPLSNGLREVLEDVQARERLGNQIEVFSIILGTILVLISVQIFLDFYLKIPWFGRALFLAGDVFLLRFMWRQGLNNFLSATLSDEEAALRIEKHFKFLEGSLIGAVELSQGKPGATQGSPGLLRALVDEASEKTAGLRVTEAVSLSKAYQWGSGALLALALVIFMGVQTWPTSAVLLQRMVLLNPPSPFGTEVDGVTGNIAQLEGQSAKLSADAVGFVPSAGWIRLVYPNGREEDIPVQSSASEPAHFETVIPGVQEPFRYRFFLHDGEGGEYQMKMETLPVVQSLKKEKADAKGPVEEEALVSGRVSWEEGKNLKLVLTSSLPLKTAVLNLESGSKKIPITMTIEGFGRKTARVEIPESNREADRFSVELVGENNMKSERDLVYQLERVLGPKTLGEDSENNSASPSQNLPGMRAKDRIALLNLQSQPVPDEYTAMVRQYLKNISEDASKP